MLWGQRDVRAEFGVAAGGNLTARDIILGLTPAQVQELMRELFAQESAAVAKVEELSRQLGVTEAATRRFFEVLGEQEVPVEQLPERLTEIAARYKELLARLETTGATDPEVQRLKEQAREALGAGEFDRTEEFLNRAKARDLSAVDRLQADIERMQADLDARKLSAAQAAAENGALMMTRLHYADAAQYYAEAVGLIPERYAELLSGHLTAWAEAARHAGDYRAAVDAARRALALDEARLPADHPRLAADLNDLASLYQDTGRYAEAEPLYERALAIDEKTLGPEHPAVTTRLNNLAVLYRATGRYAEAEPLFQRALAIGEKVLAPDLAAYLNNLGLLYQDTGRYAEAEPLHQRALAIGEKVLGPEHPAIALRLNNLAGLYQDTGRWAEAEPLYRRALAIVEKTLPADHPHQALFRKNYTALKALGRTALRARVEEQRVAGLGGTSPAASEGLQPAINPFKGVGRNDPCPCCGSGKKFKKCCLR